MELSHAGAEMPSAELPSPGHSTGNGNGFATSPTAEITEWRGPQWPLFAGIA